MRLPEFGRAASKRIIDMAEEIEPHAQQITLLRDLALSSFAG